MRLRRDGRFEGAVVLADQLVIRQNRDRQLVNVPHQEGVQWLTEIFSRSAGRYPDHTALQIPHTGESLTFAELDAGAERVAAAVSPFLTGPDQVVAVAMPQDNWQIVAAHCGACHSTRLVTQNRGSRETWLHMIRWMQDNGKTWLAPRLIDRTETYATQRETHEEQLKPWQAYQQAAAELFVLEP